MKLSNICLSICIAIILGCVLFAFVAKAAVISKLMIPIVLVVLTVGSIGLWSDFKERNKSKNEELSD